MENVYAQHIPLMMTTIEAVLKSKIKDSSYPTVGPPGGKPQEVGAPSGVVRLVMNGVSSLNPCRA